MKEQSRQRGVHSITGEQEPSGAGDRSQKMPAAGLTLGGFACELGNLAGQGRRAAAHRPAAREQGWSPTRCRVCRQGKKVWLVPRSWKRNIAFAPSAVKRKLKVVSAWSGFESVTSWLSR